jgi:hypothetical protein
MKDRGYGSYFQNFLYLCRIIFEILEVYSNFQDDLGVKGNSSILYDLVGIHRTIQAGRACCTFLPVVFVNSKIFTAFVSYQECPKMLQVFLGNCM